MAESEVFHEHADAHVYHHSDAPGVRIKLERGQKGTYAWEVAATAPTVAEALAVLQDADTQLRAAYGGTEA